MKEEAPGSWTPATSCSPELAFTTDGEGGGKEGRPRALTSLVTQLAAEAATALAAAAATTPALAGPSAATLSGRHPRPTALGAGFRRVRVR